MNGKKYTVLKKDPKDLDFFVFFWSAIKHLPFVQFLAQVISCFCSGITIYYLLSVKLSAHLPETLAMSISFVVAVIAAVFVEKLIAGSLPPIIRQISRYGLKFKNFQYTLMFLVLLPFAGGALCFNYMLNQLASEEIGEVAAGEENKKDITAIAQQGDNRTQLVMDAYKVDKEDFDNTWTENKQAIIDGNAADIEAQDLIISQNETRLRNGHKWAQGHIDNAKAAKTKLKKKKAVKLEKWANSRKAALKELEGKRDSKLAKRDSTSKTVMTEAAKENEAEKDKIKVKKERYSSIAAMFGLGSVYVTFLCICLIEVFEAGSKIEVDFVSSYTPMFHAIWIGISGWFSSFVRGFIPNVPAPIPPQNRQQPAPVVVGGFGSNNSTNDMPKSEDSSKCTQAVMHNGKVVSFEVIGLRIKDYSKRLSSTQKNLEDAKKRNYEGRVRIYSNAYQNNVEKLQYWQGKKQEWMHKFGSL